EVEERAADHFLRRVAEEVGHPLIDVGRLHFGIDRPDALLSGLDNAAVSLFAGLQRLLRPLPLRDIEHGAQEAKCAAVLIADDLRLLVYGPDLPVRKDDAMVDAERGSLSERREHGPEERRPVFRQDDLEQLLIGGAGGRTTEPEDAIDLVRPADPVRPRVPLPTPQAGDLLGARQA